MKVKSSAIIYTGYAYQTLQGVKLLAEWLHNPAKFTRAAFEADNNTNEVPQGIDDIVFERTDGICDFWQVKFTPSPDKAENFLTWDWLLDISGKTDRSRSILKKLFDAITAVDSAKLGDVVLLTNKRPDRIMESCLRGSKIEFAEIDEKSQDAIVFQLGSVDAAKLLFSKLTIQSGDGDYQTIRRQVQAELLKFSDEAGVERLIERAREWAMFKDNPPKNGWIYLNHVREILSPKRPEPISEIFSVPEDYCLPNADFHKNLINKIASSNGQIITLTGKPGVGKSTYLSFLCRELEEREIPLIRHHYFLSLGDATEDRLSPRVVAESFLHQIDSLHNESNANTSKPENLREALSTCANYYKSKGKPFVLLIDGLDHVWRDNAKNKKPLDETFRQLLPTPENLVIIVGTQPVDDKLLPQILLTYSPKKEWLQLPEMTGNSIYEFLKLQLKSGRLFLNCHDDHADETIQTSAEALLKVTTGYPLHVIYSSEFLANSHLPLSSWEIEKLPPCSGCNITTYYSELWRNLNHKQRDVLHICSDFQFAWPRHAIGTVVNDDYHNIPSVNAVAHMLSEGLTGVRPFHESLVVFVKNQEEHHLRINVLLPEVCKWLEFDAPIHLRDDWLWSSQARIGDSSNLRRGISRDWILDHLIIGMPIKSCIRLLSEAETYAFEETKYAEAYRHRALKTRLLNGPEFQTSNLASLEIFSLIDADEPSLNEIISGQNEYSPIKLSQLATALWHREQFAQSKFLSKKAIERFRTKTKILSSGNSQDDETETRELITAGVLTDSLNYDAIFENGNFANWSNGYINSFRNSCVIKRDLDLLLRAWQNLPCGTQEAGQFELNAIRLSIMEEADITERPEYKRFSSQQLSIFWSALLKNALKSVSTYPFSGSLEPTFKVETSLTYYNWFFSAFCIRLSASGDYSWLPVSAKSDRVDISAHYTLLNELADCVAHALMVENTLNFDLVCSLFPSSPILDQVQWETRNADMTLKRVWIEIAADCHLITTKTKISCDELRDTIDLGTFRLDWLRLWYKDLGLNLLTDDAAELLIVLEIDRQLNELEQTIENSSAYLELAQIGFQHKNTVRFNQCLRKTWDFVLGYGHHKDPTLFDVLKAVEHLATSDLDSTLQILERISPIVFNISEFTDGDETRHSKHSISSLLAKLNPQTAASIYEHELSSGEWYYAEETISKLLERCDFASPITKCLYLTGLHSGCYEALNEQIKFENQNAMGIAYEIENTLGIRVQPQDEEGLSKADEIDEKITLQPLDYPPEKFLELIDAIKGKFGTSKFWKTWYTYWIDQGRESDLLTYLAPHLSTFQDRYDDTRHLLDLLFFSQKKLSGKTKAFNLLIASHTAMNGWSDWYEREENSIKRLKIVAEQYPKRIDEFITRTTSKPNIWKDKFGNLIIPDDKLVFLLAQGGRKEEALQLTLAMIDCLEESVRNLKLPKPALDWRRDGTVEEALTQSLISRLKLPVPSIKIWVIDQISQLLADRLHRIEELLIHDLKSRRQESECVEVLSVFLVAKYRGYVCPSDLGRNIKARSTLSDLILSELVPNPKDFGSYAYPFLPVIFLNGDNHRFDFYQGSHVPTSYNYWLEREERMSGLPFVDHYRAEWNNTFEYLPASPTQIDYFVSGDRQRSTGQFYTQASHRGRSAFLRTVEIAKQFYGMPDSYASYLSTLALPIEPAYIGLKPQKPAWLPDWKDEISPIRENLIHYVEEILESFNRADDDLDILALSFPIRLNRNQWIDLTLVKVVADAAMVSETKINERPSCFRVGCLLERKLSYEFNNSERIEATPLAIKSYPFMRYGHWHSDLESRGFYVPNCNIDNKDVTSTSIDGLFCYSVDGIKIGFSSYWNNHWQPIHPKGIRSLCGTFSVVEKEKCSKFFQPENEGSVFFICEATILLSEDSYREFTSETINFLVPIGS